MKIRELRALSIIQPGAASLMKEGGSVVDRAWKTHTRGYVAIHASGTYQAKRFAESGFDPDELDYGAVIGFAKLVDVIGEEGDYGLVFKNVIRLKEPVETKGMMGLWKLEGKPLQKCLAQLSQSQIKRLEVSN